MAAELDTLKQEIEELKQGLAEAEADNSKIRTENRELQSVIEYYKHEIAHCCDRLKHAIESMDK